MMELIINKYRNTLLYIIGVILISIAAFLCLYSRIALIKEQVFSEMELLINGEVNENEDNPIVDNPIIEPDSSVDVNTGFIDENNQNNDVVISNDDISASKHNASKKKYIGYLEIPRISLKYGLVDKNSYYNNVNRNLQIIKSSDFPDKEGGNLIIAGHSGNSQVSYFKNLYKLEVGDIAKITYKNNIYTYKIVDIYKEKKDGTVTIKRDTLKTTLTLITCTYKDNYHQTIYIAELSDVLLGG